MAGSGRLPIKVDRNTTVGILLANARTAAVLEPLLRQQMPEEASETAREAITDEMLRQMLVNSPLRSIQNDRGCTDEEMRQLIDRLQQALDQP